MARLLKEDLGESNTTPQTFLLFTRYWAWITRDMYIEQYFLKSLQEEKNWAIITFEYESCFPNIDWIPKHRVFQLETPSISAGFASPSNSFKDLVDVLKNPNFDRYEYAYQGLVLRRDNLFTEKCFKDVKKIHITTAHRDDIYLPMALAVLRKVNLQRKKNGLKRLEIIFITSLPCVDYIQLL